MLLLFAVALGGLFIFLLIWSKILHIEWEREGMTVMRKTQAAGGRSAHLSRVIGIFPVLRRYRDELPFRAYVHLWLSLALNLSYVVGRLLISMAYGGFWLDATALYHLALFGVRLFLLCRVPREEEAIDRAREWGDVGYVGILLLLLDVSTVLLVRAISRSDAVFYPALGIWVQTLYTVYFVGLSAVGAVRYRRLRSPLLSAVKSINLTASFLSLFSLFVSLLVNTALAPNKKATAVAVAGALVCASNGLLALRMIVGAARRRDQNSSVRPS